MRVPGRSASSTGWSSCKLAAYNATCACVLREPSSPLAFRWVERLPTLRVSILRVRISPWYVACMCAETGTSRGDEEAGGATSRVIAATTFFTSPSHVAVTWPDADPVKLTLFNGRRAVETAAAICPTCMCAICSLAVLLPAEDFL